MGDSVRVLSTKRLSLRDGTVVVPGPNLLASEAVARSQADRDEAHFWAKGPGGCLVAGVPASVPVPVEETPLEDAFFETLPTPRPSRRKGR